MMKKNQPYLIIAALLLVAAVLVIGSLTEGQDLGAVTPAADTGVPVITASSASSESGTAGTANPTISAGTDALPAFRIGSTLPGSLKYVLLNKQSGFTESLAKDGTRVEYIQFLTDKDTIDALTSGSIDIAYTKTAADPVLTAVAGGADIKIIGLASTNPVSPSAIVVRPDDKRIYFLNDLKGKKIAYLNGTENQAFLYQALKQAGLSFKDITPVNIDYNTAYSKLQKSEIDAIVADYNTVYGTLTFDPQVAGSKGVITGRVITTGKEHPGWAQPTVIAVTGNFSRKYPDVVKRLLAQDALEAAWADGNYQKTVNIFADATNQKETAVLTTYPYGLFYLNPTITDSALVRLKAEGKYLNETGQLKGQINWNTLVDTSYLN